MNPILLYHSVSENPGRLIEPFSVTPATFSRHLDLIQEEGYKTVTFSQLLEAWTLGKSTEKMIVITFDDGYGDFATTALPEMQNRNMVSTLYITTGFLDGNPSNQAISRPEDKMLHWDEIPDIAATGTEIGAHSQSHPHLDTLSRTQLRDEIFRPKGLLEDKLQKPIASYAYPHGYCGPRVKQMTQAAGYESAAGVRDMLSHRDDDRFNVARLLVRTSHTDDTFRGWLQLQGAPKASGNEALKTKVWRKYRRLRAMAAGSPINVYAQENANDYATNSSTTEQ